MYSFTDMIFAFFIGASIFFIIGAWLGNRQATHDMDQFEADIDKALEAIEKDEKNV